jgi:undecaprenyl-diphosphatase
VNRQLTALLGSTQVRLIALKVALVVLLGLAVTQIAAVAHLDVAALHAVRTATTGWLTGLVRAVTDIAGTQTILAITAAAVGLLAAFRHWRAAVALALSVALSQAVVAAVKVLVSRPRPDEGPAIGDPSGFSFPSAHSATAVALYAMLALIAAGVCPRRFGPALYAAAALIAVMVGASRIYLGVHYPSDVLAGWLIGAIIVVASWAVASRLPGPRRSPAYS